MTQTLLPAVIDGAQPLSTDLVLANDQASGVVILDQQRFEEFFEQVKKENTVENPDVSTAKGRDRIKSAAFKVVKIRTGLVEAAKRLKADAQKTVQTVDASKREMERALLEFEQEVRAPLTKWEEDEKRRIADATSLLGQLRAAGVIMADMTADITSDRLDEIRELVLDPALFGDMLEAAEEAKAASTQSLEAALVRLRKAEADAAELEQLRQQAAARAEEDRLRAEAAQAEENRRYNVDALMQHITDAGKGAIGGANYPFVILLRELEEKVPAEITEERLGADAPKVEAHRVETLAALKQQFQEQQAQAQAEAEAAEAQRIADAAAAAKEEARLAAEAESLRIQQETEARHAEELAAAQRRAEEAEAAAAAEAQRIANEAAAAQAARDAEAAAETARQKDRDHRSKIMSEAKVAMMAAGADEEVAKAIVKAILLSKIPHVSIKF